MAECVAGFRAAGASVVSGAKLSFLSTGLSIYGLLALTSLLSALLWQWMTPLMLKPQSITMHFYRHVIGELDGRRCASYPVCSSYASQAVAKHGYLLGSWMAMDRLIHEQHDMRSGDWFTVNGEQRLYDPLSRNDFWIEKE